MYIYLLLGCNRSLRLHWSFEIVAWQRLQRLCRERRLLEICHWYLNVLAVALLCCLRMQASHQHFGAFGFEFHALNGARDFCLLFRTKEQVKVSSRFRLVRLHHRIWGCNLFRNLFFRRNRRSYRDCRYSHCVLVRSLLVGCDLYTFLVSIINFDPVLVFVRHCLYCRLRC